MIYNLKKYFVRLAFLTLFFGRGIKSSEPEDDVQPGDLNSP